MGVPGHTPFDLDSVLYAGGPNRRSAALEFSRDELRLIRFLYLHLKPGDGVRELRQAFDRYWDLPASEPAVEQPARQVVRMPLPN